MIRWQLQRLRYCLVRSPAYVFAMVRYLAGRRRASDQLVPPLERLELQ